MTRPDTDETDPPNPREIITLPLHGNEEKLTFCGTGCACGKPAITSKLKMVIMLIVLAAVAIALIYRRAL